VVMIALLLCLLFGHKRVDVTGSCIRCHTVPGDEFAP
jgi:hypothetical protein